MSKNDNTVVTTVHFLSISFTYAAKSEDHSLGADYDSGNSYDNDEKLLKLKRTDNNSLNGHMYN